MAARAVADSATRRAHAGLAVLTDQGERGGPGLIARAGEPVGDLLEVVGQLGQQREAVLVLRHQVDDILELTGIEVTEDAAEVHAGTLAPTDPGCARPAAHGTMATGGPRNAASPPATRGVT